MDIIGIIAEYNPFHNGHIYHINKIKEMYPNSLIILILNGYFLERGQISIESIESKTKIALDNNVDIVIQLPFIFGSNSSPLNPGNIKSNKIKSGVCSDNKYIASVPEYARNTS